LWYGALERDDLEGRKTGDDWSSLLQQLDSEGVGETVCVAAFHFASAKIVASASRPAAAI
jgi:hypothetical protein